MTLAKQFPTISFGTSGVRALVSDITPSVVSAYIYAFLQHMRNCYGLSEMVVAVGMDLRPSSPSIAAAVCGMLHAMEYRAVFFGALPTPAFALQCLSAGIPGVMVTGSHIPFDRNGIKFYSPIGEILKADEDAIVSCPIPVDWLQCLPVVPLLPPMSLAATDAYIHRYIEWFGAQCLAGQRVGLYEHSAVGRDVTKSILSQLGATVISLGRSDEFVPIDTEAVGESDLAQVRAWCTANQLDAVVSTDGDGDRPLLFDELGEFVRGDLLGVICARELGIRRLVVPVNCNTAIEQCGSFQQILRTRIGSPFVIMGMHDLARQSHDPVAGFEANGGFLLGSSLPDLRDLPTRDALLPMLSLLVRVAKDARSISSVVAELPKRYTYSDRIKNFPNEQSRGILARFASEIEMQREVTGELAPPIHVDTTDGIRLSFAGGDIVHLRASGNAPELRCYAEAASLELARSLCVGTLDRVRWKFLSR